MYLPSKEESFVSDFFIRLKIEDKPLENNDVGVFGGWEVVASQLATLRMCVVIIGSNKEEGKEEY